MTATLPADVDDGPLTRRNAMGVRQDLDIMLLPFFPDEAGGETFSSEINGVRFSMKSDRDGGRIATSSDRKVLNLLAAEIGQIIRSGKTPSRHIWIRSRAMIDAFANEGVVGGTEYQRINERLERLASTRIVAERFLSEDRIKRKQFNWIDAFEQDIRESAGGRKIMAMKITLSEEAFEWITRNQGFDLTREDFHALTASRSSSTWRIYEICLASLVRNDERPTWIPLDELRLRVPIAAPLKVFKARTLKVAMANIATHAQMSLHINLSVERKTDRGFEPLPDKERVPLQQIFVCVRKGPGCLPEISQLIPDAKLGKPVPVRSGSPVQSALDLASRGGSSARLGTDPHDLPLFWSKEKESSI